MPRKKKSTTAREKMEEVRRLIRKGMDRHEAWAKVDPMKDART